MDVGARLRQARESHGLSREALARATRIPPSSLAAIEQNDVTRLPPYPYNKGFIEAYAREVDLEPHATAREFLDQFQPVPPPSPGPERGHVPAEVVIEGRPQRLAWLAIPIAALLWFVFGGSPAPERARPDPASTAQREPVVLASTEQRAPVPVPDARPAGGAAESPGAVSVVLTTTGTAWVEARADGQRVLYELLDAGAERRLLADRDITMRIGDASAVSLVVNGRPVGTLGDPGQIRVLRITPEGVR